MADKLRRTARWLCLGLLLAGGHEAADAIDRGTTAAGMAYVSGGVGDTELLLLHADRDQYSFWLSTAAKRSGAHLAGVRVRIIDVGSKVPVLVHSMDGPWLFCALPPGRYEVQASYREVVTGPEQTLKGSTTIRSGDHHQMVLYFDTGDETGIERTSPFPGNPYDQKK